MTLYPVPNTNYPHWLGTATAHDAVSVAASSNNLSDWVDVRNLKDMTWTVKNGNGTNVDFEVFASIDGVNLDTVAYHSVNLGASAQRTGVLPGTINFVKIKATNNDGTNASIVTTKINGTFR